MTKAPTTYWCEYAWLGGERAEPSVVLDVADGRILSVEARRDPPPEAVRLAGLTTPGMANSHSHAFHRVLRGGTHDGRGTFWSWRDEMYRVAGRLDPDTYHHLARAVFAEMVLAGFTVVGEFHYLHHQPDATRYSDPNAMGHAVTAAAAEAGIRLTLLDTCYLHGGLDAAGYRPLDESQRRFGDGSVDEWAERVDAMELGSGARVAAAVHSVRAVDPDSIRIVHRWATERDAVVHIHLSEQPAENEACLGVHGVTPAALLARLGVLDDRLTAVHATHLTNDDIDRLGRARVTCCFCPTTERDLADGIGESRALVDAGALLALGSDSQAVIDGWSEARAVELDERLASGERGCHEPPSLVTALTRSGYRSLGWADGGALAVGALADLTTTRIDSVRLAGVEPDDVLAAALFAATASDVHHVVVGGDVVVRDGLHTRVDVTTELAAAIRRLR